MRAAMVALSLIILTAIALSGCARANGAAPATPQKAQPSQPAQPVQPIQPAPAPKDKPAISDGWEQLDPETARPPAGFDIGLGNEKLKALVFIGAFPTKMFPGVDVHVTAFAYNLAENGIDVGEVKPIEGADAAWVPFEKKNGEPPYIGGFAAKTSAVRPEMTIYFLMFKIIDPAGPDQTADIERCRKDLIGILRTVELAKLQEPADGATDGETDPNGL